MKKRLLLRLGMTFLSLLIVAAAFVAARLGLATLRVARAKTPDIAISSAELGSTASLTILPLYEEAAAGPEYIAGHGVSYLVRTDERTILMDLGNNPEQTERAPLVHNMQRAGVGPADVDVLFISHNHPDHLGGLQRQASAFDTEAGASVLDVDVAYAPAAMELGQARAQVAEMPQVIAPGVATLGRMPFVQPFPFSIWEPLGYEQALAVNVEGKGLVLITGCGHPSLEKIVARAEALFEAPVVGVVGGLHYEGVAAEELASHVQVLALRDTQLVALSPHDSGPQAIRFFQQAFPSSYRHISVGEAIRFGALSLSSRAQ